MALAAFGGYPLVTDAAMGPQPAGSTAFSPDGRYLAVINSAASLGNALGAPEMLVRVFDVNTGESLSTLTFGNQVISLAFSPDGNRLATAGHGVQVWDWRLQRLVPAH